MLRQKGSNIITLHQIELKLAVLKKDSSLE